MQTTDSLLHLEGASPLSSQIDLNAASLAAINSVGGSGGGAASSVGGAWSER
jgi:hypothetical protein